MAREHLLCCQVNPTAKCRHCPAVVCKTCWQAMDSTTCFMNGECVFEEPCTTVYERLNHDDVNNHGHWYISIKWAQDGQEDGAGRRINFRGAYNVNQ